MMRQIPSTTPTTTVEIGSDVLTAIIHALADATGKDMETMPLVSDAVNIEALCELIAGDPTGSSTVVFEYENTDVVVDATTVEVYT